MAATLQTEWAMRLRDDIFSAKQRIIISALSCHPPRKNSDHPLALLWAALEHAARRGVDVHMLLPAPSQAHPATRLNLLAAEKLNQIGVKTTLLPPGRLLHAKTVAIDAAIAWVGSGNWTAAAAAHNYEAYARIEGQIMAEALADRWLAVIGKA
jgi:phosphatidylserine/phosphatidylglycerophosphate/cardiolipin synthase-like enzyme